MSLHSSLVTEQDSVLKKKKKKQFFSDPMWAGPGDMSKLQVPGPGPLHGGHHPPLAPPWALEVAVPHLSWVPSGLAEFGAADTAGQQTHCSLTEAGLGRQWARPSHPLRTLGPRGDRPHPLKWLLSFKTK